MLESAAEGTWAFSSPTWQAVTPEAKQLICALLTKDPNQRIDVSTAVNHPWVASAVAECRRPPLRPTLGRMPKRPTILVHSPSPERPNSPDGPNEVMLEVLEDCSTPPPGTKSGCSGGGTSGGSVVGSIKGSVMGGSLGRSASRSLPKQLPAELSLVNRTASPKEVGGWQKLKGKSKVSSRTGVKALQELALRAKAGKSSNYWLARHVKEISSPTSCESIWVVSARNACIPPCIPLTLRAPHSVHLHLHACASNHAGICICMPASHDASLSACL